MMIRERMLWEEVWDNEVMAGISVSKNRKCDGKQDAKRGEDSVLFTIEAQKVICNRYGSWSKIS
jgi:hypothetical protein